MPPRRRHVTDRGPEDPGGRTTPARGRRPAPRPPATGMASARRARPRAPVRRHRARRGRDDPRVRRVVGRRRGPPDAAGPARQGHRDHRGLGRRGPLGLPARRRDPRQLPTARDGASAFPRVMGRTPLAARLAKRARIRALAFPGTGIAYVPHTADLPRSAAFASSPPVAGGTWHPDDRLFVLVRTGTGQETASSRWTSPSTGRRRRPRRSRRCASSSGCWPSGRRCCRSACWRAT